MVFSREIYKFISFHVKGYKYIPFHTLDPKETYGFDLCSSDKFKVILMTDILATVWGRCELNSRLNKKIESICKINKFKAYSQAIN